jgi:hypothetical protein
MFSIISRMDFLFLLRHIIYEEGIAVTVVAGIAHMATRKSNLYFLSKNNWKSSVAAAMGLSS